MESWKITLVVAFIMATMVVIGEEGKAIDKEACKEQRLGLAKCIPYMKGQAKSPTTDCCSDLKMILNSDKNCICVIIQDRNDPDSGLQNQINNTIAFTLPSICNVTANVAKCPALLHLDPNSPEAQVFYYMDQQINHIGPASAPIGSDNKPTTISPTAGSDHVPNNNGRSISQSFWKQWLGLEVVVYIFVNLSIMMILV